MGKTSDLETFIPGSYALVDPRPQPQDAKSPPIDAVSPDRTAFLTVDPAVYVSPSVLEREKERLFARRWICAGRASDAAEPGDWFRFDLAGESFIIVRGRDGALRAFYNVCQHRGAPLVAGECGRAIRFVCAYHAWTYDLTGQCVKVTDRQWFRDEALCGSLDLASVRCETWAGFVFINQDADAPPLAAHLAPLPDLLSAYAMEEMHIVKDVTVAMAVNWKVVLHANMEAYHFQAVHPEALPYADDLLQQVDFYPNGHSRFITPTGQPSARLKAHAGLSDEQKFLLAELGVDPTGIAPDGVRAALQAAKRRADNPFGLDYSRYSDGQLTDDWSISLFPNMTLNAHPEGVLFMRYLPDAKDPERSLFHVMVLAPKLKPGSRPPGYMGVEDDADLSGARRAARLHRTMENPQLGWALDQDVAILRTMGAGVRSKGLRRLRFGELEQRIQHFFSAYHAAIAK
jgi:phenylpropionate dioxygenase-like ring-hydroxylating dioxygenase large terminal subunit